MSNQQNGAKVIDVSDYVRVITYECSACVLECLSLHLSFYLCPPWLLILKREAAMKPTDSKK